MDDLQIDDFRDGDGPAVLALNAANVPEVGPMDPSKLELLRAASDRVPVVRLGDRVVGFAVLMTEGSPYESPNYRWFSARHPRFYYVDRIALDASVRGRGIGARIYRDAVARAAATGRPVLCAEVNTIPPNPGSSAFHRRMGFHEVARTRPYRPDEEVAMLERPVDTGAG